MKHTVLEVISPSTFKKKSEEYVHLEQIDVIYQSVNCSSDLSNTTQPSCLYLLAATLSELFP